MKQRFPESVIIISDCFDFSTKHPPGITQCTPFLAKLFKKPLFPSFPDGLRLIDKIAVRSS